MKLTCKSADHGLTVGKTYEGQIIANGRLIIGIAVFNDFNVWYLYDQGRFEPLSVSSLN